MRGHLDALAQAFRGTLLVAGVQPCGWNETSVWMKETVHDKANIEAIVNVVVQMMRARRSTRIVNALVSEACDTAVTSMIVDGAHA